MPRQPVRQDGGDYPPDEAFDCYPPVTGCLPVQPLREEPLVSDLEADDPAVHRMKVTLTPRPTRPVERDRDEDVHIYLAPPLAGLGSFDLGSVPASVTPPKTSRKAAWFAALSSSGVVIALLFAGALLVGQPAGDQAPYPGYRAQPLINGAREASATSAPNGGVAGPPAENTSAPTGEPSRFPVVPGTANRAVSPGAIERGADNSAPTEQPRLPASTLPRKPPITPAPIQSQPPRFWPQLDARQLGKASQDFLNQVPSNPAAARDLTTGPLRDGGPRVLAEHYAGIAYFEVKRVYVDQYQGYTVNTVEVTHQDGTKTIERRVLIFGNDNKIKDDGR